MSVWQERGKLEDLRSVLDPADQRGTKNRLIDRVHKLALQTHFPLGKRDLVLDFGCGIGRFTAWLGQRCRQVVGVELTWEMVSAARRISGGANREWLLFDGRLLPLASERFDGVLSVFVLQHIENRDALGRILTELGRTLKPGGQIAVIEQVQLQSAKVVQGYIAQRLAEDYRQIFQEAGFEQRFARPVRLPRLAAWAGRGRIPEALIPLVARFELYYAARAQKAPYADCLMIFQKPPCA